MPPLIESCNDGWKYDTSELGGKVKRMSTCITDVIEFEIDFASIAPGGKICVLWGPLWPSGYAMGIR